MSREWVRVFSVALVLLLLGAGTAPARVVYQPGPGPQPEFDPGGSDTDPDDFPFLAGRGRTAELDPFAGETGSAKTFLRVLFLAAGVLPR
ncbi:MAG: hypothetical protein ABIH26_06285 [Candidatus Eisenbacteria bacterium]